MPDADGNVMNIPKFLLGFSLLLLLTLAFGTQPVVAMPQIAFTSDRDGKDDVWLMNLDGTNVRNFTATRDMLESMPSWLSDTAIVFLQEPDRRNQVTRVVTRMNFQREVSAITQMRPITSYAITADGSLVAIVFLAAGPGGEPLRRLFVLPQGGGDIAEIVRQTDTDALGTPAFRP